MSRVELFGPAHKALRYAGARVLVELGKCVGELGEVARALAATRDLLVLHAIHQRVEDTIVIPAIEARRPGASVRLADAHADHAEVIGALRTRLATLEERGASPEALHALYLEVSRFVADNFLHMYEEETLAGPLLEEAYSQAELAAFHARIPTVLSQAERDAFLASMLPALSHTDRAHFAPGGSR